MKIVTDGVDATSFFNEQKNYVLKWELNTRILCVLLVVSMALIVYCGLYFSHADHCNQVLTKNTSYDGYLPLILKSTSLPQRVIIYPRGFRQYMRSHFVTYSTIE